MISEFLNTYKTTKKIVSSADTKRLGFALILLAIALIGIFALQQHILEQGLMRSHEDDMEEDGFYQQPFETTSSSSLEPTSLDVFWRKDDYLESGENKSYSVYLYSDKTYDIDLDINTTDTLVDFEIEIRDPSNQLVDFTEHDSVSQGIDISLDLICSQRGSWSVVVISEYGNASFSLLIFDTTINTPSFGGTVSDPEQLITEYDKYNIDRYRVYLQRYISYDFELVYENQADFEIEIRDATTNEVLLATESDTGEAVSLDCIWNRYDGYYYLCVTKDLESGNPRMSGSYALVAYNLNLGSPSYQGSRSPLYQTILSKDEGDIYTVNLRNLRSYDIDLEGLEPEADFEIHVIDFLKTFDRNTTAGRGESRSLDFPWVRVDGTYYIVVYKEAGEGQYCLSVWDLYMGKPSYHGTASPQNQKFVSNDSYDFYCVYFEREYTYDIDLTGFSSHVDFEISIADQYMEILYNSSSDLGVDLSLDLVWVEDSGEHYVIVRKESGCGPYSLDIWKLYMGYSGVSPSNEHIVEDDAGDIYSVYFQAGYSYDIDLIGISAGADFEIRIFDLVGEVLYNTSTGIGQEKSIATIWNKDTGIYYVEVQRQQGLGYYSLSVSNLDLGKPGYGRTMRTGSLVCVDDVDVFRVYLYDSYPYDIDLISLSPNCDFEMQIVTIENEIVGSQTAGNPQEDRSLDVVWNETSGYYYIKVFNEAGIGHYQLQIWNLYMNNPTGSRYGEVRSPEYQELYAQDSQDIYSVTLHDTSAYEIDLFELSQNADFEVEIRDDAGTLYFSTDAGVGEDRSLDFIWRHPNGIYYLHVIKESGVGPYELIFKNMYLDTQGSTIAGKLFGNDQYDFYTVDFSNLMSYDLDLRDYPSTTDFEMQVLAINNTVFYSTSCGSGEDVSIDFVWTGLAGRYYVRVYSELGSGSYKISLRASYFSSNYQGNVQQELLVVDSCDVWRVYLYQFYSYDVDLTGYSTLADFEVQLINYNGDVILETTSDLGEEVSADFILTNQSGYYYIKVIKESGLGSYELSWTRLEISNDESRSDRIWGSDRCDIWVVDLSESYSYDIDLVNYRSTADFEIQIIDANNTILQHSDSGFGEDVSLDFIWTDTSGRYYIRVSREGGQGIYTLRLYRTQLNIGYVTNQEIVYNDAYDIWRIHLDQYYSFDIDLQSYPSTADFEMQLLDINGTLYYSTNSKLGEDVSLDFIWTNQSGYYYIKVLAQSGYGVYSISTERPDVASPSLNGRSIDGIIVENDTRDITRIYLQQGKCYDLELREIPSWTDFELILLDANGTLIGDLQTSSNIGETVSLDFMWNETSGYYYIAISAEIGWGPYLFCAYETDLGHPTYAEVMNRFIADVELGDYYKIVCDEEHLYAIVLDTSEGLIFKLLNATDGSVVGGPFSPGTTTWKCTKSGTYLVSIQKNGTSTSSMLYNLQIQRDALVIHEYQSPTSLIIYASLSLAVAALGFSLIKRRKQRSD